MGDQHRLVRRDGLARLPRRDGDLALQLHGMHHEPFRRQPRTDQRLHERIGGETVGAVQTRRGALTHRRKPLHGGTPVHRRLDAAAAVVRRRHDGDQILRHVDAEGEALFVDVRETLLQVRLALVPDVEEHARRTCSLHLGVDGAGHDVARRQGTARVVLLHERTPLPVHQHRALAPHGLGDEEALGVRMVKAGGMELDELHVLDLRPGAPRERDAVARRRIRVTRIEVHLAAAARGENRVRGADGVNLLRLRVQDIRPHALVRRLLHAQTARRGDEVDHRGVLKDLDLRMAANRADHRRLALLARNVASMEDAPRAVSALTREIPGSVGLLRKLHATQD